MHGAVQISKLNDFIFCPNSLYLHSIYESFVDSAYKQKPQIVGTISHANIDKAKYSSSKRYIQGAPVYSEKYSLIGKIDLYDSEKKALIDRKYKVKKIYDGYRYQLYAQYFSMIERGYEVKKLYLHSLSDNIRYPISLPDSSTTAEFERLLQKINQFSISEVPEKVTASKCSNCIYNTLCPYAKSS